MSSNEAQSKVLSWVTQSAHSTAVEGGSSRCWILSGQHTNTGRFNFLLYGVSSIAVLFVLMLTLDVNETERVRWYLTDLVVVWVDNSSQIQEEYIVNTGNPYIIYRALLVFDVNYLHLFFFERNKY